MRRINLKVKRLVMYRGYERAGKRGEWVWGGRDKDRVTLLWLHHFVNVWLLESQLWFILSIYPQAINN